MKKIDMLEIKTKVICAGLGLAAESELNMLRRLEDLMIDGIAMGYDFLAQHCEAAEQIIAKLTMDHNSTPNYVPGFDAAQRHFAEFPNNPIRTGKASELIDDSPIFPIARVVMDDGNITESTMCAPGLPDGEHLLYPVLVVNKVDEAELRCLHAANVELVQELKALRRAYINLLETCRDRIVSLGGQCDDVSTMEASDPYLKSAVSALAKHGEAPWPATSPTPHPSSKCLT